MTYASANAQAAAELASLLDPANTTTTRHATVLARVARTWDAINADHWTGTLFDRLTELRDAVARSTADELLRQNLATAETFATIYAALVGIEERYLTEQADAGPATRVIATEFDR